ncbi:MAG: hypothetical protein H6721_05505 [Sandaracinus sp.]|nr:hypothetical protein [Sandaracinus sp.]MCB9631581.1 hypothetical protein [Sandaracinus sp.]
MERRGLLPLLALALAGCGSDVDPLDPETPAPVAPTVVPRDLSALALEGRCVEVGEGERVEGVGSEGELWIGSEAAGAAFRVELPEGTTVAVDLGMAPTLLRPWSASQAAFAVESRLFVREGDGPLREVGWPRELGPVVDLCGDPRRDGAFVIAEGAGDVDPGLYRRAGGEWWRWTPPTGSFGPGMRLAEVAGACTADDDRAWLRSGAGLFGLREDRVQTFGRVDAIAIDRHVGVAAASEGKLIFLRGDEWKETRFEAGDVDALVGSAGHLWANVGGRLHHYADGAFEVATMELPGAMGTLHPDAAGGVWVETGAQVCHRAPSSVLRLRGVRPFERHVEPELNLAADAAMQVELDGDRVLDGATEGTIELGAPGWHRLEVRGGDTTRRFDVMRVDTHAPTWEEDVRPIAEAHCGGSACHGAERDDATRPALADYESWVDMADAIRHRVGVVGDMPPAASRDGWTATEVTTVVAWIAAGMEERDASE